MTIIENNALFMVHYSNMRIIFTLSFTDKGGNLHNTATIQMSELQLHEQMAVYGRLGLTDQKLIECLGIPTMAAEALMNAYGHDLGEIAKLNAEDLQRVDGITKTKATALVAALEIGRRRQAQNVMREKKQITMSLDAYDILKAQMRDADREQFWIILTDRRSKVVAVECIHIGGTSAMVVDPKTIFQKALQHRASCVILSHNHPSGAPSPSIEDIRLTEKLKSAGSFLDIKVLDHIIIGDGSYYSFADDGKM